MEKITSQRGSPKEAKLKKEQAPLKVVYISDPVKVTARPAEFRALVQRLTGRDSDIADLSRFDPMVGKAATCSPATECNTISPSATVVGLIVSPYDAFDEALEELKS
uniref:VQ domain-containing protein n=1 Tax=Ananas comosus var. bracteatus TaxID=296719 RepID=A0A6V7NUD1_ANACO|nr:unnamed protein product [Ananas comosus var. bracteatus]